MATAEAVTTANSRSQRDYLKWLVWLTGLIISIAAYLHFNHLGSIIAYKDAISHMEISRRVVTSPTNNFAQLGGVWLPLQHVLMLPFVWINSIYYDGLSGSIISMVAYIVCGVLIYKTVQDLTGSRIAGVVGALVFLTNPNILYMQSTPMSELLLFACMAGMVYGVQRWIRSDRYPYLIGAGFAGLLGVLTRYEAWVLAAVLVVVVIIAAWRKGYGYRRIEGTTLSMLTIIAVGIVGWMIWNLLIFGNPLYFQIGPYAKPSLWVGEHEVAVGDWGVSLKTYYYAVADNLSFGVIVLSCVGIVVMGIRERMRTYVLPTFSLLVLFVFFVMALEGGQRPLHVTQVGNELYNVRFGLLMILPAAIAIGYLVSLFAKLSGRFHQLATLSVAVLALVLPLIHTVRGIDEPNRIATYSEPITALKTGYTKGSDEASTFLRSHYDGGLVLMESFGNELVLFNGHVDLGRNIYEGSYQKWQPALKNPSGSRIRWVVMRRGDQADKVYQSLYGSPRLRSYRQVFTNKTYYIFKEMT